MAGPLLEMKQLRNRIFSLRIFSLSCLIQIDYIV